MKESYARYGFLLAFTACFIWIGSFTYFTISLSSNLMAFNSSLNIEDITNSDFDTLGILLPRIDRDINFLNVFAWPTLPFIKVLSIMPTIGPYAEQVIPIYIYFSNIAEAGNLSYPHIAQLVEISNGNIPISTISQQLYQVTTNGKEDIRLAADALNKASLLRSEIDAALLPEELKAIFMTIDQYAEKISQSFYLLAVLPDMLGTTDAPTNYLLVAQNRDELRATGGFITGIGTLQVVAGELISLDIGDSYDVDDFSKGYPPPPEPIQKFMLAGYWVPRDANWSPDFPTSAQIIQQLYELSSDHVTQGVIAFDQDALISLISLVGPLELDGFSDPITGENVEFVMQQARAAADDEVSGQAWLEHRKDFMAPIGEAIIARLMEINDRETILRLGSEVFSSLKSGHILLYFNQPEAQLALSRASLDHSIKPADGDFLYVVDSNIGFNKVDAVVERSLTYLIDLSSPEIIPAMLIARYSHTSTEDFSCEYDPTPDNTLYSNTQERCYLDYWRIYTHRNTEVYSANKTPIPANWLLNSEDWPGDIDVTPSDFGIQEIAGVFMLPAAQTQDVVLQLLLPLELLKMTQDGHINYNLKIQKQAGISQLPFVLQINPPLGYQLSNREQGWQYDSATGFWVWEGQIKETMIFDLLFSPVTSAPP